MLARAFGEEGHEVVILSRSSGSAPWRFVSWDAKNPGDWIREIDGADVVINLAGRNVNCRYTEANRRQIKESRIQSTEAVGRAIAQSSKPPRVWLQASTATIYAHRYDAPNEEETGLIGGSESDVPDSWKFSIEVAKSWEAAAYAVETPNTRRVMLRSSIVLSPDKGGIFDVLLDMVRRGLGGTNADGRQYVSWIHGEDFIRALKWLIDHELEGAVNVAAPNPLPNAEFMRTLRKAWGAKIGLPSTRWMLDLGAIVLKTETELILKSRRVVPKRLLDSGFEFRFPTWNEAATDLCLRWRYQGVNVRE